MEGPWKEAQECKADLPKERQDMFASYLQLLYVCTPHLIDLTHSGANCSTQTGLLLMHIRSQDWLPFWELYVLAEMLMDDMIKDLILRNTSAQVKKWPLYIPEPSAIRLIYEGTPERSPTRALLVKLFTQQAFNLGIEDWSSEKLDQDFLYNLSVALIADRPLPRDYQTLQDALADTRVYSKNGDGGYFMDRQEDGAENLCSSFTGTLRYLYKLLGYPWSVSCEE
jgi:hypothetical protein